MIHPERVCVCCVWCSAEALAYQIGQFLMTPPGWCCGPRGQVVCSWQHAQQLSTAEALDPAPAAAPVEAAPAPVEAAPAPVEAAPAPVEAAPLQVPAVAAVQMPIELLDASGKVIAVSTNGTSYGQEEVKA